MMLMITKYFYTALGFAATMVFLLNLLPSRIKAGQIIIISLGLSLLTMPKYFFDWNVTTFNLIDAIACIIVLFLIFQGNRLRQVILFAYFSLLLLLSEAVASAVIALRYEEAIYALSEIVPLLIHRVFGMTVYILLGSLSVIIRGMIAARKFQPSFLLFFILPIGQIITVYSFMFSTWTAFWLVGVLLSLVADLVLLVYTISQEKKTGMEEELRETRHQMELEQAHYRAVEQRRDELAKLRHDFSSQLASVAQLVRSGEEDPAQDLIRALSKEINRTKENPYCAIPVVNAILTEKAQECAAAGIGLEVELDMPARLSVEQMHLCSIFSNLLDNAISPCMQVEGAAPTIRLTSMVDGDYLFIKAVNLSPEPPKKPLPGRGYGSRILSDLSARYGGSYQGECRDGLYTAVVSLLALDR